MSEEGVIRKHVSLTPEIYESVESERKKSQLAFSTQVNQMLSEWRKAQRVLLIGEALNAGLITDDEAKERIATLAAGQGIQ
jgi:hypothetical protein